MSNLFSKKYNIIDILESMKFFLPVLFPSLTTSNSYGVITAQVSEHFIYLCVYT